MKVQQLVICGNDKIGRRFARRIADEPQTMVVLDRSSSLRRVLRLVRRGSLSPRMLIAMALAEMLRPEASAPDVESISNNSELLDLLRKVEPQRVFLFRAGLIVSSSVLACGIPILNLHCARLPEYGGLGSIFRALTNRDYNQQATLHHVTSRIDEGEVLEQVPYRLDPRLSYRANEEVAYGTGMALLVSSIRDYGSFSGRISNDSEVDA